MSDLSSEAARALGKLGASKGGQARAKALTPSERSEIARRAVEARWARSTRPLGGAEELVSLDSTMIGEPGGAIHAVGEYPRRGAAKRIPAGEPLDRAAFAAASEHALARSSRILCDLQKPGGFWCADLLADTTLESDYILTQLWLYPPRDGEWNPPTMSRIRRAAESILARQRPAGGYDIYPEGDADVSASVKAYTALKLAGIAPDSEPMQQLRQAILDLGGIQAANS